MKHQQHLVLAKFLPSNFGWPFIRFRPERVVYLPLRASFFKHTINNPNLMKFLKFLSIGAIALASLGLSSCGCCTGEEPVPPLRPLPAMNDIAPALNDIAPAEIPVVYEK